MKILVDTGAAQPLAVPGAHNGQRVLLHNIGTGIVYFDYDEDVDATTGMKLAVGATVEVGLDTQLYVMATVNDTDLRYFVS